MWLFFYLVCKEVYHIIVFIAQLVCFIFFNDWGSLGVRPSHTGARVWFRDYDEGSVSVSYPGSPHTLNLQYETGFVCKYNSTGSILSSKACAIS